MTGHASIIIGLTGSIGMGKTTTAKMFANLGIPVWDADEAVHRLYATNTDVLEELSKICPDATLKGIVDRPALKKWITIDPRNLKKLEDIIHPYVAADRELFLRENNETLVILDVPLLYETGLDVLVDYVVVVSAPKDTQRRRVLERNTMSEAQFDIILSKQMPDAQKRVRADFVIETTSLELANSKVKEIVQTLKEQARA